MATRWGRFARAWLAAVFSTLVAAASHTIAGGTGTSAIALLAALAFAGVACVALTGTALSLPRTGAAVAVTQLAFHLVFSTFGSATGAAVSTADGGHHAHAASTVLLTPGVGMPQHHATAAMWAAHAAAGLLTVVALRYGEGAFWRLRGIALLLVRPAVATAPTVHPLPRAPRRPAPATDVVLPRTAAFLSLSLGLRGPPVAPAR